MASSKGTTIDIKNAKKNSEILTFVLESATKYYRAKKDYTLYIYKFRPEDYITVSLAQNKYSIEKKIETVNNKDGLFICIPDLNSVKRTFGYNSINNYVELTRVKKITIIGYVDNLFSIYYTSNTVMPPFTKQCIDTIHDVFKEFDYYYFYSKTADAFGFLDFNLGLIKYESKTTEILRKPDITSRTLVGDPIENLFTKCDITNSTTGSYYYCKLFVDLTKINNLLTDSCKLLKCCDLFNNLYKDSNGKFVYLSNKENTQAIRIPDMWDNHMSGTHYNNGAHFYKTIIDGLYLLPGDVLDENVDYSKTYFKRNIFHRFLVNNHKSTSIMRTPNNAYEEWFINKVVPNLYNSSVIYEKTNSYAFCVSSNFTTIYDIGVIMQHYINDFLNGSIEFALVDSPDLEEPMYMLGIDY